MQKLLLLSALFMCVLVWPQRENFNTKESPEEWLKKQGLKLVKYENQVENCGLEYEFLLPEIDENNQYCMLKPMVQDAATPTVNMFKGLSI